MEGDDANVKCRCHKSDTKRIVCTWRLYVWR